ncbi:hypothetical protein [Pandoraea sp.]|uniref:hypothetical protein n=1 Tax=Pandoraea sp. TaxID=1883445 RepID=UPI00121C5C60|nr:hypothetical protein [Pandoraea sp.]TAL55038.1 MAG: hypothetical protein EPN80_08680 [Pandoraea sp.]TAM19913.1 MAG: hypothetical protein EPN65_02530 [Pandoraea sp.]
MSIAQLIENALTLLAAGAAATFLLGISLSEDTVRRGSEHGRFGGMSLSERNSTRRSRSNRASRKPTL